MTTVKLAAYVRFRTKTDPTTFPDADMLVLINVWKDEISREIEKKNEDYFNKQFLTSLVANQRQYSFPDEILNRIKIVEVKLDGTNWKRAAEVDFNLYQKTTDENTIQQNFSDNYPQYELTDRSIYLLTGSAISNVTNGLSLWGIQWPADFTSLAGSNDMSVDPSSTTAGFPRQFHKVLADKIVIEWKSSQDKPVPLTESEMSWEKDLMKALDSITNANMDREFYAQLPHDTGEQY